MVLLSRDRHQLSACAGLGLCSADPQGKASSPIHIPSLIF